MEDDTSKSDDSLSPPLVAIQVVQLTEDKYEDVTRETSLNDKLDNEVNT